MEIYMRLYPAVGLMCIIWVFNSSISAQDLTGEDKYTYLKQLDHFLSIPNNGLYIEHIEPNIEWLIEAFSQLDFDAKRLETNGQPLFFAQKISREDLPTVLFYMHLDGQSVDSSAWNQPSPYEPVYKSRTEMGDWQIMSEEVPKPPYDQEWRIFARSASDDKGPIIMLLAALQELQKERQELAYNVKIILDSEEERGSPHLLSSVQRYSDLLSSNYLVVSDGPMHDSGLPTLTYGVRGLPE